jgi:hypothetical protein
MNRETACLRFEDLVSAERELTPDERRFVTTHRESCADCRAWESLREGLRPFTDTAAEDVPETVAAAVWPSVEARVASSSGDPSRAARPRRRSGFPAGDPLRPRRWSASRLMPALAAAAAVLVVVTGLLAFRVRGLERREQALLTALDRREALLDDLRRQVPDGAGAGATVELAGLVPEGGTTVGDLLLALDALPPDRDLLSPTQAETLMRRLVAAVGGEDPRLASVRTDDGLQAGEAARLLSAFALDPEQKISRTRLLVVSRGIGL